MVEFPRSPRRAYVAAASALERGIAALDRRYTPLGRFTPGDFTGWNFLWKPALWGFLAMVSIVAGCSFSNAPFKLEMAKTWFFGVPTQTNVILSNNETTMIYSVTLVFGGLVLLLRVWLRLVEIMKHHGGAPFQKLYWIFLLWCAPLLVAPPLFSRDVFSYAAQGEMTSHHLSPYVLGPFSLGSGPYVNPVDSLWGNTPAPYGPLFLSIDGFLVKLAHHNQLATVVLLRLLEFMAIALMGWALPMLARAVGRDPGEVFTLAAMNPLVLLTLIGGAHNDALMTALLVTGVALAAAKRPMWGLFFCACATAIKAPAALGIVYVAWSWRGAGVPLRRRITPLMVGATMSAAVLGVTTLTAGFGLGWVKNLSTPGTVRSWSAPATGTGMAITGLLHTMGFAVKLSPILSITRALGLATALGFAMWLFARADQRGWIRSLAISLLVFVILGPVVQPWYLTWGLVLLAASYVGREHFWMLLLSIIAPFIGLPGGRQLLAGLVHANLFEMVSVTAILAGVFLVPLGHWTQWSWPLDSKREPALDDY